jgi:SAM-dependent methyltransferase
MQEILVRPCGSEATPMAHEAIYDRVLKVLQDVETGKLLDVPAGEGALAARLVGVGFEVHCCDLYPEIFRLAGVEIRKGDLGGSLPYADASFDYLTCIEGLEHIENPQQAVREFARLLKPGGQLITSVPNILNIEERLKWLFYGYTSHFKPLTSDHVEGIRREFGGRTEIALHLNPIGYSELRYTLEKYGFVVQAIYRDKPKSRLWLYWPIVALIRLVAFFTPERKRRERWTDELISNEILLGGNTLILHAVRK